MSGFSCKRILVALVTGVVVCLWAVTGCTVAQAAADKPVVKEVASPSKQGTTFSLEDKQSIVTEIRRELLDVLDKNQKDVEDRNELRSKILDYRADNIGWWLAFIAIVFTVLGVVLAAVGLFGGYIGFNIFRDLRSDAQKSVDATNQHLEDAKRNNEEAKRLVEEIKGYRDESQEVLGKMTAESAADDPEKAKQAAENVLENPQSSSMDQAVAKAFSLQEQDRIDEAIKIWRGIADVMEGIDNNLAARAWFSVGYLFSLQEKHKEALTAYYEALRLKPDEAHVFLNRGIAKRYLGQHEAAIADFDEALRLKPDEANAYHSRGIVKRDLGQHEAAIADFDEALRLKPDYADAYHNRGHAKTDLGQHEAAIADFDKALRLDSNNARAYCYRGLAKTKLGQQEAAIADLNKAIDLDKDIAMAYYNRGIIQHARGLVNEAREDFTIVLELVRSAGNEKLATQTEEMIQKLDEQ